MKERLVFDDGVWLGLLPNLPALPKRRGCLVPTACQQQEGEHEALTCGRRMVQHTEGVYLVSDIHLTGVAGVSQSNCSFKYFKSSCDKQEIHGGGGGKRVITAQREEHLKLRGAAVSI